MAEVVSNIDRANAPSLKLLAKCDDHSNPSDTLQDRRTTETGLTASNYLKDASWSPDGTCVITNSADNCIRTFVVPPDLLDERTEPLDLKPYSTIRSYEPTDAVVAYSHYNLQDPATTLILSAVTEHPIRLNSALTTNLVASYPLVNSTTETFIKPQCLLFTQGGSHFIAGSEGLLSTFDLSRSGQEPVSFIRTGPRNSKKAWTNPGASMRGIVSALVMDPQYNILAAGTLGRYVGLYDSGGNGECVGVFYLQGTEADNVIGGKGITQMFWSPCGRYLYIAERKSDGVSIYDIRKTGQMLGWLEGRHADTNQRLRVDITSTDGGSATEVWAGGTDGFVRAWRDPHHQEGGMASSLQYKLHEDAVSSSVMHPSASLLATASGQRHFSDAIESKPELHIEDVSLKLWCISTQEEIAVAGTST